MKWEYKILVSEENEEMLVWLGRLNAYGDDGWELVGIIPENDRNMLAAYVKRPKVDKKGTGRE